MTKNIVATLVALSMLPSVASAYGAGLSQDSNDVFTYTLRARDLLTTGILSTNGSTSCTVVANMSAGTLNITPRTSASVSEATEIAGNSDAQAITVSGTTTLITTPGQFSAKFSVVGTSTATVVCDAGGNASGTSYDNTISGLASSTVKTALDEIVATTVSTTAATSVLLQNENGIANVSDPNDTTASPDVVCSVATAGKCLFFSSAGIGFVNESTTEWQALNPTVYSAILEPVSNQLKTAMGGNLCVRNPERFINDRTTTCAVTTAGGMSDTYFRAPTDITLDRISIQLLATSEVATAGGCGICVTLDAGLTCLNAISASTPSADGINHVVGNTGSATYNHQLAEGDIFEIYTVRGEFSGATGAGECAGADENHIRFELETYPR